jgi:sulfur carrier protein ThiS
VIKLKVFIEKENKTIEISESFKTVKELLEHLKINPSTVLIVKNDEVALEEEPLEEKDNIKFLSVVSGG